MASLSSWPPAPAEYYLPPAAHRPVFQGDVFDDVPLVKARSAGDPSRDPNVVVERRKVAVLGYPCDIYAHGRPVKVQTVAPVTTAEKVGIPPDWDGAFTFAPLPDLLGDGVPYAVDLRTAANIDASYLQPQRRLRSLSEIGWAVFRQRMALCDTRAVISLPALLAIGASTWAELELWQRWNETGRGSADFQTWLDGREPTLGGFVRRKVLERGMVDQLRAALEREMAV